MGQQQFRVQLQSVDLSVADLELMCKPPDASEQAEHARQSDEGIQSGLHVRALDLALSLSGASTCSCAVAVHLPHCNIFIM